MNKNIFRQLNKAAFCALISSSLFAEEAKVEEQFIITATKTETEAREIGKSFTVISRQEIENSNHHDLVDILRRVPGLSIAKAGPNGTTGIYIRGNESHYTKVLLNGMPLEDASGTQVTYANIINSLSLDNIEKIEIIRGPQSVLYGSDAIGGVINIITRNGSDSEKIINGSIRQEFGKDNFSKTTLSTYGSDGVLNYSMSLSHEKQDSISATNSDSYSFNNNDDYYHNTTGNLTLGYTVNEFLKFGLTGSYFSSDVEFDLGPGFAENYIQNSTIRPSITLSNLLDDKLETEISFSHSDHRRTNTSGGKAFSETHKYEILNTLELADWNTLSFGFELTEQFVDTESTTNTRVARYQEMYVQEQLSFDDRYFLTFGGRYSNHDQFGEHWTYQIAPAVYLEETGTKFHASFGTAYRAPSLFELFQPATVYDVGYDYFFDGGDPTLDPEESEAFDIGFEQELFDKKLKLGATYFYSETDNKIAYVESIQYVRGQYAQFGLVRTYGFESFLEYSFNEDLYTKLMYTRTHSDYEHPDGDVLMPRVPKDTIHLLINWQVTNKLNLDTEVQYTGNRYSDYINTEELDSYWLTNLSASYDLCENLRVFARIHNLFDENYSEVYGFQTYGRSFFGGLEYKF